jgi:hypothetical protein
VGPAPAVLALALAAPLADVWPYALEAVGDGGVEYRYDLLALKRSRGPGEAREAHGDEAVQRFLASLPAQARVRVFPSAPPELTVGRGPESRPLAPSFASVSEGPLETDGLLPATAARLRPALDARQPHLLVSGQLVAHEVRALEDAALVAEAADAEPLQRELWSRLEALVLGRLGDAQGEARQGALLLAAHLAAASSCLNPVAGRGGPPDLAAAVESERQRLVARLQAQRLRPPWTGSAELACAGLRQAALATPLPEGRAGAAAVLTFLEVLASEPRLGQRLAALSARRRRFQGAPATERLAVWARAAGSEPGLALERLDDFLAHLPPGARPPPPLLEPPSTSLERYLQGLQEPERARAWEELAQAVEEGRVAPGAEGLAEAREAALAPLLRLDGPGLPVVDSGWRELLRRAFVQLLGGQLAPRPSGSEDEPEPSERSELRVRLMVPPWLEVEPLPGLYEGLGTSLQRLEEALQAEHLTGLRALGPAGAGSGPLLVELGRLRVRLAGLAALSGGARAATPAELAAARSFLSRWRVLPAQGRDVREMHPTPGGFAAVTGVARRELVVGFGAPPGLEVPGAAPGLVVDATARQRYLVPVLEGTLVAEQAARPALGAARVRAVIDGAGRDPERSVEALREAMR